MIIFHENKYIDFVKIYQLGQCIIEYHLLNPKVILLG